ncbi:MAG: hypothetical protein WCI77_01020 [Candidatus Omnitrophota bacterium]
MKWVCISWGLLVLSFMSFVISGCSSSQNSSVFSNSSGVLGCTQFKVIGEHKYKGSVRIDIDFYNNCSKNVSIYLFDVIDQENNVYSLNHQTWVSAVNCFPTILNPNQHAIGHFGTFSNESIYSTTVSLNKWYVSYDGKEEDCWQIYKRLG